MNTIQKLKEIFEANADKRIVVLGTTCAGKTTLLESLPNGKDADDLIFATLPKEVQSELSTPAWTTEMCNIWREYVIKAKQTIKIEAGHPLFAATLFESDIIVYLDIDENTLREQVKKRNADYQTAADNNNRIKEEIKTADKPTIIVKLNGDVCNG